MGSYQDVEMQPPSQIYCPMQTEWKYANAVEHLYALIIIWVTAFPNEANILAAAGKDEYMGAYIHFHPDQNFANQSDTSLPLGGSERNARKVQISR
jgi:hypothetical protein